MFRTSGKIDVNQTNSQIKVKFPYSKNEKKAFLQYLKPLTPENPYFFVTINDFGLESKVIIGVGSPEMPDNSAPGLWNNTIGFENTTGRCFSSHRNAANTFGRMAKQVGDKIGIMIGYFGTHQSTCVFMVNDEPIATRYHFEPDSKKFLPTFAFENGPIELEIHFQDHLICTKSIPDLTINSRFAWIKPENESCTLVNQNEFENVLNTEDMPLQSSFALSKSFCHYKCTQLDLNSIDKKGASVGLASCSPLKPTPTSTLLRDYYTWLPHMKRNF
jgi:hypothetical protein